ncbi:hypothetical protein HDU76_003260 [Blyttiomyces sp. JEL0837]|nr:hypothetical protein HDU76_003260 [Blyttiomyces sp. JEL0837]
MSSTSRSRDSLSMPVKELAAEGKNEVEPNLRFPGIPVYVIVVSLLMMASAIVTIPAVDDIYKRIQDTMDESAQILNILLNDDYVHKVVTTNFNNLRNEIDLFLFFQNLLNMTQFVNVISCVTYPNLFPGANTTAPWPNVTYIVSYRARNDFVRYIIDWFVVVKLGYHLETDDLAWINLIKNHSRSTGPLIHISFYSPEINGFVQDIRQCCIAASQAASKYVSTLYDYKNMVNYPQRTSMQCSYSYTKNLLASSIDGSVWDRKLTPTHVTYSCSVAFDNNKSLDLLLQAIKVTPNTHVFLMDSVNGILLSSSVQHTTFMYPNISDPMIPVIPFTVESTNDSIARNIGMFLKDRYGNYSLIPNENRSVSIETTLCGKPWLINYRYLDRPSSWIVVIGIPHDDFFGNTDNARMRATILVSTLTATSVLCVTVTTWLAMRPLHKLTVAMKKLTNRDFSALEGDILTERSFMLELRELQVAFAKMCKAFSTGLRQNKALMTRNIHRKPKKSTKKRPISKSTDTPTKIQTSAETLPSSNRASSRLPTSASSLPTTSSENIHASAETLPTPSNPTSATSLRTSLSVLRNSRFGEMSLDGGSSCNSDSLCDSTSAGSLQTGSFMGSVVATTSTGRIRVEIH